jgi:2-polyprenyl-3-methyl-5-hydroxy-6-metoxy-1,4-benzoquinol methylase
MRFLDVAAGSGALSIPAARLGAQVLATDQSPVMLELLSARAREEGLDIDRRLHQLLRACRFVRLACHGTYATDAVTFRRDARSS